MGVIIGLIFQQYEPRRTSDMFSLRDREENLSITLNSIGDGVVVTDTAGRVVRMNPYLILMLQSPVVFYFMS